MPKGRAFIDRKKSVAFKLVHRSQRDPLIAVDDRELVLAPIDDVKNLSIDDAKDVNRENTEKRKLEQVKYGIYFDDDYDYLQHLKDVNEVYSLEGCEQYYRLNADGTQVEAGQNQVVASKATLLLPSSLFESKGVELKTGLLNQAAPLPGPHPELDPDIVAALDDDNFDHEDPENLIDDDFVLKANAAGSSSDNDQGKCSQSAVDAFERPRLCRRSSFESDEEEDDEEEDDLPSLCPFEAEETRSRFTHYSLTSSVMRRSDGLKQVDAVFEKLYEQYDDEEVGELQNDDDQITGFIAPGSQRVAQMLQEYEQDLEEAKTITAQVINAGTAVTEDWPDNNDDQEERLEKRFLEDKHGEKWDCESILSTYSTLYNHPTMISEPSRKRAKVLQLEPKTGLPVGVLRSSTLAPTLQQLNADDMAMELDAPASMRSRASTIRAKDETPEQRRQRKAMVKTERRERRQEKKQNKLAFKTEEIRSHKEQINAKFSTNMSRLV